ncbi:DUF1294 domain-containing protein [Acidovorax sp. SUPP2522]|uniref:cold shock and DUF1294 domain-containing protein n=1 Tax=unclassified Acidovorax TaxID=2684926 RepID=UPI00234B9BFE|nr:MULTISPECIES: cold shock and DUF1294 domain-containing protein [unclassified Acidovorax]WCM99897.1 cold shock and DUF1294 domain-containing protein [Acidovorax sp. GBBC 1281]GKT14690.1 DUF1294 domain-containing protein [Acidovorax sp. SUPP2522]
MQKQGTVLRWDATRGFGFLRSGDTGVDVFFHARDLQGLPEPRPGLAVVYEEIHVGGKGPRAMAVRAAHGPFQAGGGPQLMARRGPRPPSPASDPPSRADPGRAPPRQTHQRGPAGGAGAQARAAASPPARRRTPSRGARSENHGVAYSWMVAWLALVAWGVWTQRISTGWLAALVAVNVVTFAVYASDKDAARSGGWRTSEQRLHLLAVLGGWPAAWWAQQWLRHKSSKASFRAVYWLTVAVHCAALAAVLVHQSGILLRF